MSKAKDAVNIDAVKAQVTAFKSSKDKEGENYIVLGYSDKTTLAVIAEGQGFVDAAKAHLSADEARYVLLRKDFKVEMAKTVKFAFIDWTPSTIAPLKRALLSTHKGQIKDLFGSVHATIQAGDANEVSDDVINSKLGDNSGTSSKITDKAATEKKAATPVKADPPAAATPTKSWKEQQAERKASGSVSGPPPKAAVTGVPTTTGGLKFTDEKAFTEAVKSVRSESGPTWLLANWAAKDTIGLVATGNGDVSELVEKLEEDNVNFAIVRVLDIVDNKSKTLKFAYIKWQPESVAPMKKAAIGTKKGDIDKLFQPFHVSFQTAVKSEISQASVEDKVKSASGTKSNVK